MFDDRPIVITGGAGFIGVYAALELERRGTTVVLTDTKPPTGRLAWLLADTSVKFEELDVTDREATCSFIGCSQARSVVHAAAIVDPVRLLQKPELAADVNVMGTVNVLAAAHRAEIRDFVYISSVSVLPRPQEDPISVEHTPFLRTEGPGGGFYGASKVAGEAFCHAAIDGLGMQCSIVRPSAVYGFGMSWGMGVKEMVEDVVHSGGHTAREHVHVPRDLTYVRDVSSLVAVLADGNKRRQRTFFAATGKRLATLEDVAGTLRGLGFNARVDEDCAVTDDDIRESSYRGRLDIRGPEVEDDWKPEWNLYSGLDEFATLERRYLSTVGNSPPIS